MTKNQIHKATFQITRHIELPQYESGGIEVELRANDEKLGELTISGAHVYFKAAYAKQTKSWDFTHFIEMLEDADSQY